MYPHEDRQYMVPKESRAFSNNALIFLNMLGNLALIHSPILAKIPVYVEQFAVIFSRTKTRDISPIFICCFLMRFYILYFLQ